MREKKVCYLLDSPERVPQLITRHMPTSLLDYPFTPSHHRLFQFSFIHCPCTAFFAATIRSFTYYRCDRAGLDNTLDFPRGAAHLAGLDPAFGPRRQHAQTRGHRRRAPRVLCVHFILVLVSILTAAPHPGQAHLRHYTEPSTEPLPATSSALQDTILPLGPETFAHNTAAITIIVACTTKADLIDDNPDLVGAGASGMGGMVKGKGDEWEERTDEITQILGTICLECACAPRLTLSHYSHDVAGCR